MLNIITIIILNLDDIDIICGLLRQICHSLLCRIFESATFKSDIQVESIDH